MRKIIPVLLLAVSAAAFVCCTGGGKATVAESPRYNRYVEVFTSGRISRTAPVMLMLNRDIDSTILTAGDAAKYVKIKPAVQGDFTFADSRTVSFRPSKDMETDKTYTVTVDLGKLIGAEGEDRQFSYSFTTLPLLLRARFDGLDINNDNQDNFDVRLTVATADKEEGSIVESLVKFSESTKAKWSHSEDGRTHSVVLPNIQNKGKNPKVINVSIGGNKLNVAKEDLLSIEIPSSDGFKVYSAEYRTTPERYVEVIFNKNLDEAQDMRGLAMISGIKSESITVQGNTIRMYPGTQGLEPGNNNIFLDKSIRNIKGETLGEHATAYIYIPEDMPSLEFLTEGVIVPSSSQMSIPFRAVYLRGVKVKVLRILEGNIGMFLQENNLDGSYELARAARPVAYKTIWLDELGDDMSQMRTYAIDLKQIIEPEPGAIYRVELSTHYSLTAYPCDGYVQRPKSDIEAQDALDFKEMLSDFDNGSYYYYSDYYWYSSDSKRPCTYGYYDRLTSFRNVLATDFGLIAKGGNSDEMTVLVHNILTTEPEQGVEVMLYNYQNQLLGKATSDAQGLARIPYDKGRPYYVKAVRGNQFSYVRVDRGSALNYSSFDITGEVVQKGIKGFIYGDRGVWRPGDVLYLSFMLNDRVGNLPADLPVTMELYNPLGQLYMTKTQTRGEMGLYAFEMPTDPEAPTGAWEARVLVGGASFTKRVRVETVKPNRLKIDLDFGGKFLRAGERITAKLHVEWLTGATARNLRYEMDGTVTRAKTRFSGFDNFVFDDPGREFDSEEVRVAEGATDEKGDADVSAGIVGDYDYPGMLNVNLVTRVYEESGDFSIDGVTVPYSPYTRYVGINSPQKNYERLETGMDHQFQVAVVTQDGKPVSGANVRIEVYELSWYWWWNSDDGSLANYMSDSDRRTVQSLNTQTGADGKGTFKLNFSNRDWGTYFIRVIDSGGSHSSGVMAYFDWPDSWNRQVEGSDAAHMLNFKADKTDYKPGEKITLTVPSAEGSKAVVSIENGSKVLSVSHHKCVKGETQIKIDATDDMQPGAYISVMLLQPHARENDLPIRMYGVIPVKVTSPESRLVPQIKIADEIRPEERFEVTVSEKDGRPMAYTLAIVDEGLLDLTRFRTPDPWTAFNAREALGVRTWDMYNYIIGAYGGRIEQMFSIGGDGEAEGSGPKAIVNRFKPVVMFDGPFVLKKGEKKLHRYDMPNYNGRVRVMVVAGDGRAYGNTDKSVMVRKPVMVLGTLPRVIGVNEEMAVPATVFATKDGVGNVNVTITCSNNMEIVGSSSSTLNFTSATDKQAMFTIRTRGQAGAGKVTITATAGNEKSVYETDIEIRSVRRPQTKVVSATIEAGRSWSGDVEMLGETANKLTLEVSDVPPVNIAERLDYLLGYPHGCIEQITSKAFPQVYVKEFASLTAAQSREADEAVRAALRKLQTYQIAEGAFAYWPGGTSSNAWGTVYATHFMLEAESKGYLPESQVKSAALANLKLVARSWKSQGGNYSWSENLTQAYRLYVLALAGQQETGAMNRLREDKTLPSEARWMLAAAYARIGRPDIGKQIITETREMTTSRDSQYDLTYGSDVRNRAVSLMALVALSEAQQAAALTKEISERLSSSSWMSTQTTAFSLMAVSHYIAKYKVAEKMEFSYTAGKASEKVTTDKNIWNNIVATDVAGKVSVKVENPGKSTLFVRAITEGTPDQGAEKAYSNNVEIEVFYVDAGGRAISVEELPQGTNLTAVVTVRNPTAKAMRNLVLTQIFPAGWEILNTRFLEGGDTSNDGGLLSYQDIRDDRVYSYIDYMPSGRQLTVRINLAAVYAGRFYLPPVYCEAMYDNLTRANTEGGSAVVK